MSTAITILKKYYISLCMIIDQLSQQSTTIILLPSPNCECHFITEMQHKISDFNNVDALTLDIT